MTDKLTLTIEDVPLEALREWAGSKRSVLIAKAARKALEKYEAEKKPYYVASTDLVWVVRRTRGSTVAVFNFPHPEAEAAAKAECDRLNGETTEPEKWWVTSGFEKLTGPFESRTLAMVVRSYIEDHDDLWIKSDSELREDK
jgi:hypothetical protein